MLELKSRNSWVDPRKVKDQSDFFYEYVVAWGFAQASDEILQFVEEMKGKRDFLLAKKEGKEVNKFNIGG